MNNELRRDVERELQWDLSVDARETDRTESWQIREMLSRLQDETRRKIEDLRREQHQESDSGPADEMNSSSAAGEIETRAGLIAMAEEKTQVSR